MGKSSLIFSVPILPLFLPMQDASFVHIINIIIQLIENFKAYTILSLLKTKEELLWDLSLLAPIGSALAPAFRLVSGP